MLRFLLATSNMSEKFEVWLSYMSLDRPTGSIYFRRIESLKIVSGTNVDLHIGLRTKLIN